MSISDRLYHIKYYSTYRIYAIYTEYGVLLKYTITLVGIYDYSFKLKWI